MTDEWAKGIQHMAKAAISAWNAGDFEATRQFLERDVVMISPYVDSPDHKLVGADALIKFNSERQKSSPVRTLVEILIGVGTVTLVLRDEVGFLTWRLEISPGLKVSAIEASYAVRGEFGCS